MAADISYSSRRGGVLKDLHKRHDRWLLACLTKRYGHQDAEELRQEAWLRVVAYDVEEIRHPRALLMRIAINLAINRFGKRRRRHLYQQHLEAMGASAVSEPVQLEGLLAKEIVLGLPEGQRNVFLLSRLDGLTNAQIAETLGISVKTVEWRMKRALAHCAAQLRR